MHIIKEIETLLLSAYNDTVARCCFKLLGSRSPKGSALYVAKLD